MTDKPKMRKKLTVKKVILICWCIALVLCVISVSVSLAKYIGQKSAAGNGNLAAFNPSIELGDEWELDATFSQAGLTEASRLGMTVTNDGETLAQVIVTVETEGALPLDIALYPCASDGVESATALTPDATFSSGNTYVYLVTLEAGAEAELTLSVEWQDGAYDERFNGITEKMHISVVCEQILEA